MIRIPSAGTPIHLADLARAALSTGSDAFRSDLAQFFGARHVGLAGSGLTAFHLILSALSKRTGRRDVVLPAYTAPSLVLPILKLGLRPVVADVSLDTFNMNPAEAAASAGPNTLAILAVHMFGIPCDIDPLKQSAASAGAALIEDAASAMGAEIHGKPAGSLGDVGFVSFNRGKNLSTASGGAWITDSDTLAADIRVAAAKLPPPALSRRSAAFIKLSGLSLAVRPWFYTLAHPLLAALKHTEPHREFDPAAYTSLQAGAGASILHRFRLIVLARNERAALVRQILSKNNNFVLPVVPPGTTPAYNQVPLLLPDAAARERASAAALSAGLECTTLYDKTVRATYALKDSECGGGPCPNAGQLASRLLLIPCHPLVPFQRLEAALLKIKSAV